MLNQSNFNKSYTRLVYGIGINDADYIVRKDNKNCPYYERWKIMLRRCYGEKELIRDPSYKDCSVCDGWLRFSNFKSWMETKNWEGKQLDKDLLGDGTIYSPATCCFVSKLINIFINTGSTKQNTLMIGVVSTSHRSKSNPYMARCNNPFTKKKEYLGIFATELEAHLAWKTRKCEFASMLADVQDDPVVAEALRNMYR